MRRFWGHAIVAVGMSAFAATSFAACVHNDSSIFVQGVLAPTAAGQSNGQGCTITADPTQLHLSSGLVDVGLTGSYGAEILIGNQLTARASSEQGRTETNRVEIQGAIITVTDAAGNALHPAYTRSASGTIDPSQGTTPGYAAVGLELVDHTILDPIAASVQSNGQATRLLLHVKMFGNTLGGDHVETNDFQFPLDVCYGCLVSFVGASISPITHQCVTSTTSSTTFTPCNVGQDQPISCTACAALPVCQPNASVVPAADGGISDAGGGG